MMSAIADMLLMMVTVGTTTTALASLLFVSAGF